MRGRSLLLLSRHRLSSLLLLSRHKRLGLLLLTGEEPTAAWPGGLNMFAACRTNRCRAPMSGQVRQCSPYCATQRPDLPHVRRFNIWRQGWFSTSDAFPASSHGAAPSTCGSGLTCSEALHGLCHIEHSSNSHLLHAVCRGFHLLQYEGPHLQGTQKALDIRWPWRLLLWTATMLQSKECVMQDTCNHSRCSTCTSPGGAALPHHLEEVCCLLLPCALPHQQLKQY